MRVCGVFDAAEVKSECDGSPEKSKLSTEGTEEASSSAGAEASNTQQEGKLRISDTCRYQ